MRESPRIRRLRTDLRALETLREESSILDFSIPGPLYGGPPESYAIRFRGRGVWRPDGSNRVEFRDDHLVHIQLGAAYPRMMPELSWKTPIFHPNISGSGVVCLGGYATHWVPSLNLDELCTMLWEMVRYANYDVDSPYNREAALWARTQERIPFPVDPRPIRDRLAEKSPRTEQRQPPVSGPPVAAPPAKANHRPVATAPAEVLFLDNDGIIDAEVVEPEDPDILFIE